MLGGKEGRNEEKDRRGVGNEENEVGGRQRRERKRQVKGLKVQERKRKVEDGI